MKSNPRRSWFWNISFEVYCFIWFDTVSIFLGKFFFFSPTRDVECIHCSINYRFTETASCCLNKFCIFPMWGPVNKVHSTDWTLSRSYNSLEWPLWFFSHFEHSSTTDFLFIYLYTLLTPQLPMKNFAPLTSS
jgi:hypothetical protein